MITEEDPLGGVVVLLGFWFLPDTTRSQRSWRQNRKLCASRRNGLHRAVPPPPRLQLGTRDSPLCESRLCARQSDNSHDTHTLTPGRCSRLSTLSTPEITTRSTRFDVLIMCKVAVLRSSWKPHIDADLSFGEGEIGSGEESAPHQDHASSKNPLPSQS